MNIQKIQKVAYFGVLISVALLFIYSLICGSPVYCLETYDAYGYVKVDGFVYADFAAGFNSFNMNILYYAIAGFVCFALFAIYNQGNRKTYYLSNFIIPIIFLVYSVVVAVLFIPSILYYSSTYTACYNSIDFSDVYSFVASFWLPSSSFTIIIGLVPVVLLVIVGVVQVLIALIKFLNQRKTKLVKGAE